MGTVKVMILVATCRMCGQRGPTEWRTRAEWQRRGMGDCLGATAGWDRAARWAHLEECRLLRIHRTCMVGMSTGVEVQLKVFTPGTGGLGASGGLGACGGYCLGTGGKLGTAGEPGGLGELPGEVGGMAGLAGMLGVGGVLGRFGGGALGGNGGREGEGGGETAGGWEWMGGRVKRCCILATVQYMPRLAGAGAAMCMHRRQLAARCSRLV